MFRCTDCRKVSLPGDKSNIVATGYRTKEYFAMRLTLDDQGNEILVQGEKQGDGTELTGQKIVCFSCARKAA